MKTLKITRNLIINFTSKISEEICFIYLNFANKRDVKKVIDNYNKGVIDSLIFNGLEIDINGMNKCLDFLNKYHIKS